MIKRIFVEGKDKKSGQILIRIETDEKSCLGRNLPMTNRVGYIENRRVSIFGKEPFNSKFIFSTILDFNDPNLEDYISQNMTLFQKDCNKNRIKLAGLQRTITKRKEITRWEALRTAKIFASTGIEYVPLEIPFKINNLKKANELIDEAKKILNEGQKLVLDIFIGHDHEFVGKLLSQEIKNKSHFFYVSCATLNETNHALTCAKIWDVTRKLKVGEHIPLIVAKHPERYQRAFSNVPSSFAFNCFNIPIVVEKYYVVPEEEKQKLNEKEIESYKFYDIDEGRFIDSLFKIMLYKRNIIKELYENNNLMEGVSPYDALLCLNFMTQQLDISELNKAILDNNFEEIACSKYGWKNFYEGCFKKHTKTLTEIS